MDGQKCRTGGRFRSRAKQLHLYDMLLCGGEIAQHSLHNASALRGLKVTADCPRELCRLLYFTWLLLCHATPHDLLSRSSCFFDTAPLVQLEHLHAACLSLFTSHSTRFEKAMNSAMAAHSTASLVFRGGVRFPLQQAVKARRSGW